MIYVTGCINSTFSEKLIHESFNNILILLDFIDDDDYMNYILEYGIKIYPICPIRFELYLIIDTPLR